MAKLIFISDMILQKSFQYDDLVLKKRILFFNVETIVQRHIFVQS